MKLLIGEIGSQINAIDICIRIVISILAGSIIGYEREKKNRPAGLRTHVLVCMTAASIALVEQQMIYEINNLSGSAINLSFGRLSVGVITGIGFIGAGTIMMSKSKIVGLTTAASLWCTACLGLIDGMGYCLLAIILAVVVIVILKVLRIGERKNLNRIIEIEYLDKDDSTKAIEELLSSLNVNIHDYSIGFHKENNIKHCVTRYSIIFKDRDEIRKVMTQLSDLENVLVVEIENVM